MNYIWVKKYNVDPNNIQIEINRLPLYSFEKGNNNEIT